MYILLDTIDKVRRFVDTVTRFDCDIDLASGRYVVDGKSIMGIFSLDLMSPIKATIHGEATEEIMNGLKPFIIEQ